MEVSSSNTLLEFFNDLIGFWIMIPALFSLVAMHLSSLDKKQRQTATLLFYQIAPIPYIYWLISGAVQLTASYIVRKSDYEIYIKNDHKILIAIGITAILSAMVMILIKKRDLKEQKLAMILLSLFLMIGLWVNILSKLSS